MDRRHGKELVYRSRKPDNLEGPPQVFEASETPVEAFFVRSHFDVPRLRKSDWHLAIEGEVARPMALRFDDLAAYRTRDIRATIECAGNSRARLGERAKGVPWESGAIGTATWTGVPLHKVLAKVGLSSDVQELVFVGADSGILETNDGGQVEMSYARSLPRQKAMAPEVLIATHMNGAPLTEDHGFPARLVVPGWYGMASVKWLTRIIAVDHRFEGYFQSEDYATWVTDYDLVVRRPLGAMAIKSHIGFPLAGQTLKVGQDLTIRGYAWGGEELIDGVDISVDGGQTFEAAKMEQNSHRFAWQAWEYAWTVPDEPGRRTLYSRARTTDGAVQPATHDWRRGAYAVNAISPVEVLVRGRRKPSTGTGGRPDRL